MKTYDLTISYQDCESNANQRYTEIESHINVTNSEIHLLMVRGITRMNRLNLWHVSFTVKEHN